MKITLRDLRRESIPFVRLKPEPNKFRVCKVCDTVFGDWRERCPNCGTTKKGSRHHEPGATD